MLRNQSHLTNTDYKGTGYADITWHGTRAWQADWNGNVIAFLLSGKHAKGGTVDDDFIYVGINMHWDALPFELPGLPRGLKWRVFANTSMPSPDDIWEPGSEPVLQDQQAFTAAGRSIFILVGK